MKNFYSDLVPELKRIIDSNYGDLNKGVEFDIKLDALLIKHNLEFNDKFISEIYYLVDAYCDSLNHRFEDIITGYTLHQGREDIKKIIEMIENNNIDLLIKDIDFYKRLKSIKP